MDDDIVLFMAHFDDHQLHSAGPTDLVTLCYFWQRLFLEVRCVILTSAGPQILCPASLETPNPDHEAGAEMRSTPSLPSLRQSIIGNSDKEPKPMMD